MMQHPATPVHTQSSELRAKLWEVLGNDTLTEVAYVICWSVLRKGIVDVISGYI